MRTDERNDADTGLRRAAVLDLLPEAVLLLDEQLGVLDGNGVGRRWLGLRPDADVDVLSRVHPDDRGLVASALAVVLQAEGGWSAPVLLRLQHVDGSWRTWSVNADNRLSDERIRALVVRARDVTGIRSLGGFEPDALLREVLAHAEVVVMSLDRLGRVRYAGGGALQLDAADLVGRDLHDLCEDDEQCERLDQGLAGTALESASQWGGRWWSARFSPLVEDGRIDGTVAVFTDVTAHKIIEQQLAEAAQTDPVTGVGSRAVLGDRLRTALGRRDGAVAAVFCDVDGLKAVNDAHGHSAGDRLLRHVAERIRTALRPADTITRYGGDEFVVVCDGLSSAEDADEVAERVRAAVEEPVELGPGVVVTPTVSVGVASAGPSTAPEDLLAAADAAVYAAKAAGRNTVRTAG